jgi:hypothetical protein
MGFKKAADGIVKKGKTEGKNLGDSGPTSKVMKGGKKKAGVTSMEMRKVGRNMARAMNQKKG